MRSGTMFSRIAWIVVIGFIVIHVLSYYFYGHDRMVENARTFAVGVAERTYAIDGLIGRYPELASVVDSDVYSVHQAPLKPKIADNRWPHSQEVEQAVGTKLSELGLASLDAVQMAYVGGRHPRFEIVMPSRQGGFIKAVADSSIAMRGYGSPASFSMSVLLLVVLAAVLYVTRRMTRRLDQFAQAATALGDGRSVDDLPENVGPRELRRASRAFNGMRAKVASLLSERSEMLGGVSHDLRTLCTRLGLRVAAIDDEAQRIKAEEDIRLMTTILDQALTFAKDERSDESLQDVDVGSLLEKLVEERVEMGDRVTLRQLDAVVERVQYVAVTRLFTNLIDNAVKYGGSAVVVLDKAGVTVEDPGQGFAIDLEDQALRPYARLEASRSQSIPGSGLGLSIAANVCRRHGWRLNFERHPDKFVVSVAFA